MYESLYLFCGVIFYTISIPFAGLNGPAIVHNSLAVGVEDMIHEAIASIWVQ